MKKFFLVYAFLALAGFTYSQGNSVNLAVIAWEKRHFENARDNANSALQFPEKLDNKLLYKAYSIRGKAGVRIAYGARTKMGEQNIEKYAGIALQAFNDFKLILDTEDSTLIKDISKEFKKLRRVLLRSGMDYDATNADKETPDSLMFDKSIECYSASIEIWELADEQNYEPYYYRGDVLLAKKQYEMALEDLSKAMDIFIASSRKKPVLDIGDLGYKIAYTQAGVFNKKEESLGTIEKTMELLDVELKFAESDKSFAEKYEYYRTEYDALVEELNSLRSSIMK